ncbi:MAG TPA: nuclear transport factor 2 family protein [Candidatus Aquilonibacter sp.]
MKPIEVIRALNEAWRDREAGTIALVVRPLLSNDVVVVGPNLARIPGDADALARSYDDFKSSATILKLEFGDTLVDTLGDVAIATMPWSMTYEFGGQRSSERGHEVYVLRHEGDDWKICWRQIVSFPV